MKRLALLATYITLLSLTFCTPSKKMISDSGKQMPEFTLTYQNDISPIIQNRCSPCHFPDGGKQKFLDTHAAVASNIDAILYRIQLPRDSTSFMPFKSKKEPLSDSLVQVLKIWKLQGLEK